MNKGRLKVLSIAKLVSNKKIDRVQRFWVGLENFPT